MGAKVFIYFCKVHGLEQPIPRHHIASIASCRLLRSVDLEFIREVLPSNDYKELLSNGETLVTDHNVISRITCISPNEEVYLRLVLKHDG